jgi:hypothetical protein
MVNGGTHGAHSESGIWRSLRISPSVVPHLGKSSHPSRLIQSLGEHQVAEVANNSSANVANEDSQECQ